MTNEETVLTEDTESKNYTKQIVFLAVIVIGLIYLFYILSRPLTPVKSAKLKGYSHLMSIYGVGADRLARPTEVAVDKDGKIYVADTSKSRIMVFDKNGNFINQFGEKGSKKGEIKLPSAITVDKYGRIYVICFTQNKMVIFNKNYKFLHEIRFPGLGPLTCTVKNDKLYVTTNSGIMIGDLKGNILTTFDRPGSNEGQVNRPTGIAVDDKGNMYIADSMNYRIEALDKQGKFLWAVGTPIKWRTPTDPMEKVEKTRNFGLPESIVLAPDGNLYIMDAFAGEILIYDKKGNSLGQVGDWGSDDGQFYYPGGMASAGGDKFVIADKFNDRVQVVRIPSPTAKSLMKKLPFYILFIILLAVTLIIITIWIWYKRWQKQRGQTLSTQV